MSFKNRLYKLYLIYLLYEKFESIVYFKVYIKYEVRGNNCSLYKIL